MILDSNAVLAILAGDSRIQAVLPPGERQHLPVVVIAEYQFGMLGSRQRRKLERGFELLESQSLVLPSDRRTADRYAEIRHALKLSGRPIPEIDLWIAALVRQYSLAIVSRDAHFDYVVGVRRLAW